MTKLVIVIPTYGAFDYAEAAVQSAMENTNGTVVLVDDASPGWDLAWAENLVDKFKARFYYSRYLINGGLTRSWNAGLRNAKYLGASHVMVTNSDVLFTPGSADALIDAVDNRGLALVGPLTNAPGTETDQFIGNCYKGYRLTDDPVYLAGVAAELQRRKDPTVPEVVVHPVNGFCMLARLDTWLANAYDAEHVFCPSNDFNAKGQRNPAPLMTLQEYAFQREMKGLAGFSTRAFVFHYRAVSRGDHHKRGLWLRKS